jgi:hypothetical protein
MNKEYPFTGGPYHGNSFKVNDKELGYLIKTKYGFHVYARLEDEFVYEGHMPEKV